MTIELDITPGPWKVDDSCGDTGGYGEYYSIGPIKADSCEPLLHLPNENDAIAIACIPEFKALADAAECFMSYLPTSALEHIENRLRGSELTEALKGLKNRIKELKGEKKEAEG